MPIPAMTDTDRAEAVTAFDFKFGEMERALWCLSLHSRGPLLEGRSADVVETLVWTLKSWWGVQGVRTQTKGQMAGALASLDWSEDDFSDTVTLDDRAESLAISRVSALVQTSMTMGVPRQEYSLASKVLHWLMPWRVPVYDSVVRATIQTRTTWDATRAYAHLVHESYAYAREFEGGDVSWLGQSEPRSLFRGLDKCLWWRNRRPDGRSVVAKDPWKPVRALGICT